MRVVFLLASQASGGKARNGPGLAGLAVFLVITLWVRNLLSRHVCYKLPRDRL